MIGLVARTLRRAGYVLAALSDGLTTSLDADDADDDSASETGAGTASGPAKVCVGTDDDEGLVKIGVEAMGGAHDGETVFVFGVSGAFARELADTLLKAADHVDPAA